MTMTSAVETSNQAVFPLSTDAASFTPRHARAAFLARGYGRPFGRSRPGAGPERVRFGGARGARRCRGAPIPAIERPESADAGAIVALGWHEPSGSMRR